MSINFRKLNPKILIVLLVVTNILSVLIIFFHAHGENFQNKYPYIDLSRNYIEQKNFIINLQPLRENLKEVYAKYGETNIAVYIEFLNSGANISYNTDARYFPASLLKLPYVISSVKKVETGDWQWDTKFTMYTEDIDVAFGEVGNQPIGTEYTLEQLLKYILIDSDNTAYRILSRNLGFEPVNQFLIATGLNDFFDNDMDITAKEYTRLIRSLYTASYLSRANSQKVLELLGQSKRNFLAQPIPESIIFAHKFGENVPKDVYLDSGIVYLPNRPYIITVMYKAKETDTMDTVNQMFNEVSKLAYDYFSGY